MYLYLSIYLDRSIQKHSQFSLEVWSYSGGNNSFDQMMVRLCSVIIPPLSRVKATPQTIVKMRGGQEQLTSSTSCDPCSDSFFHSKGQGQVVCICRPTYIPYNLKSSPSQMLRGIHCGFMSL